ncbi:sensor histidine kinase [Umezawaea tangerina]|uniref:histidine kinase n=1 Tax=Umezawaea tangerina TaxID=84725 RepID=A0A2T0T1E6_9PSEU|nr:HAMP domain-containing sensor histidine kinase [Umezawaea tangerina]PRY39498.1 two-component system sensor histidine kinase MprB [Umezawaea tangerina]
MRLRSAAGRWRRTSLRSRFTLLAAGAAAVAVIGVAVASWSVVQVKLNQQFDDQLRSYAELAAKSSTAADALATVRPADRPSTDEDHRSAELVVQFVDSSGAVSTAGADGADRIPVTDQARSTGAGRTGRVEVLRIGHDQYRVWTVARPDGGLVQIARDAEDIEKTLAELGLLHAVIGLIGVLGAAVLARSAARAALRPVDTLTAGAERVARTQDLTAKIPVEGRGEIARLAEAFNAMLSALDTSRVAQRRLVEDAGHELRTPLTSLRNNVELLVHAERQHRDLSATDRARLLADLGTQAVELSTLVGELVELAKEDTNPEPFVAVDLTEIVEGAVERARARAPHVGIETDLTSARVVGDPVSLERAVLNLLDNAAKWSPADATVRVAVRAEAGRAVVTVTDGGPGIAETDLPHVFERFYRAESARSLPGSGLGLAIVAQVVAAHGGTARAGSADTGGALVEIGLPSVSHPNP